MRRNHAPRPVRLDQRRDPALQAEQVLRLAPGAHAQRLIEKAADQEEEQQRHGRIEIDLLAAHHGLVEAHGGRQQDGERDRHVHVQAAAFERAERRDEEGLPGIGDGGQRDQRRQPAEQRRERRLHVARRPRPDRDRQQHDVHGGKARHRHAPQQIILPRGIAILLGGLDRRRDETRALERGDEVDLAGKARVVGDAEPLGGKRGPRGLDAANAERRALDRAQAAAAMHVLDGERQHGLGADGTRAFGLLGEAPGRGLHRHGWSAG